MNENERMVYDSIVYWMMLYHRHIQWASEGDSLSVGSAEYYFNVAAKDVDRMIGY